jgi:hypothetical protein
MVQEGGVVAVIVLLHVLLHPPLVTVTEYVPAALTVMVRDVEPVLHK